MATLATTKTTAAATAGVSHTKPSSVQVIGTFDGAIVIIEASQANTPANFIEVGRCKRPSWISVPLAGTYFLRVRIASLNTTTSISSVSGEAA